MKINVQIEPEKKDLAGSMKERNTMLKDLLSEVRKMQSSSMDKMMGMMKKMQQKKSDNGSSVLVQAIKESGKTNQAMMKTLKSMAHRKEPEKSEHNMKAMMEVSNSIVKAMKDMASRKPSETKTVVVKTVDTKSIEKLIDAFKSRSSSGRSRWEPSAS